MSLLLMPSWLVLTEPYVVKPSPLKLFEAIHPTYYVGLVAIVISIILLSTKEWKIFKSPLNPYLATAILTTLYLQLPPIALFEHPVSDHTHHLVPAFYMLREGNINMPNYPHPETVTPQLFASILLMIVSPPSPLENLHRISLFMLTLLITLCIYIFMRRLGANERYAMMSSALNMGLIMGGPYMFSRQAYATPLWIMLVLFVFIASKERRVGYSILAIVTMLAFVMSDPAHILLTIIPLMLFVIMWRGFSLLGKVDYHRFRNPWIFVLSMSVAFLFWIINRHLLFPLELWRIAKTMWNIFIKSISELTLPTQEYFAYEGRFTALTYNNYYMILYRIRIVLVALSVILPVVLLVYIFLNRKIRPIIFQCETIYLTSFFAVTAIVLITRGYGFTYAPWAAMTMFTLLSFINRSEKPNRRLHKASKVFVASFILLVILAAPHIGHSGGRVRLPAVDVHAVLWLGEYSSSSQFFLIAPGFGRWLGEIAYVLGGHHIIIGNYFFYERLTVESINKLAQYDAVIMPRSALMHFEKTSACYSAPEMFRLLICRLNDSHNLIYNSGNPFVTIWLRD